MKRPFLLRIVFLVLILPGCTPEEPAKEPPFQLKEFFSGFAQSQLFYSFVADYKPFTSLIEYKNGKVSRVTHKKTISDLEHSSGFGDIVLLDSYHEYSYEGNTVELERVLLIANDDKVTLGTPTVDGAKVLATSKGDDRAKKVTVFKYKNKTRYSKKRGHRQPYTSLSIDRILEPGAAATEPVKAKRVRRSRSEVKESGT